MVFLEGPLDEFCAIPIGCCHSTQHKVDLLSDENLLGLGQGRGGTDAVTAHLEQFGNDAIGVLVIVDGEELTRFPSSFWHVAPPCCGRPEP
jgi:hypothetical protein